MFPHDYTDDEWRMLRDDLVFQLALRDAYPPDDVPISEIETWVAESDREVIPALVAELVADDACPVEYTAEGRRVRLANQSDTLEYFESRGTKPP